MLHTLHIKTHTTGSSRNSPYRCIHICRSQIRLFHFDNLFELEIRSPDINGNLVVDLPDIVLFTQALGSYATYADLRPDGVIDLSDVVIMVQALHDP